MEQIRKYGLYAGLAFCLSLYGGYYFPGTGKDNSALAYYISLVFLTLFILLSIHWTRASTGKLDFVTGLKTGLGVAALAGLIYSIGIYIYYKSVYVGWVGPETERYATYFRQQDPSATPQKVHELAATAVKSFPFKYSLISLARVLFTGVVISSVLSAFMQNRPRS
jgi:hypothetical protein